MSIAASHRTSDVRSTDGDVCSSVACSTAATVSSRFSRASAGIVYLSLITSPCSVTLMAPSSVPYG